MRYLWRLIIELLGLVVRTYDRLYARYEEWADGPGMPFDDEYALVIKVNTQELAALHHYWAVSIARDEIDELFDVDIDDLLARLARRAFANCPPPLMKVRGEAKAIFPGAVR